MITRYELADGRQVDVLDDNSIWYPRMSKGGCTKDWECRAEPSDRDYQALLLSVMSGKIVEVWE